MRLKTLVAGSLMAGGLMGLAACASPTPYQSLVPERGGYSEERISENQYRVVFVGNPHTPPDRVEQFLLRRAAELTLQHGYDWFRATNKVVEGNIRTIQTSRGPVRVSRGRGYSSWGNYGAIWTRSGLGILKPIWRSVRPGKGEAVEASAEIVLGRGVPPQVDGVIDARGLLQGPAR